MLYHSLCTHHLQRSEQEDNTELYLSPGCGLERFNNGNRQAQCDKIQGYVRRRDAHYILGVFLFLVRCSRRFVEPLQEKYS